MPKYGKGGGTCGRGLGAYKNNDEFGKLKRGKGKGSGGQLHYQEEELNTKNGDTEKKGERGRGKKEGVASPLPFGGK